MIAIPVKTDTKESAVTPLFGKAKWFAIIAEDGTVSYWKNEIKSGREVVEYFKKQGVTSVIFQDMGGNPFMLLDRAGIACYHGGEGRVLYEEAYAHMKEGTLVRVTPLNMAQYVEKSHKHSGGEHHGHEGGDRHHH